MNTAVSTNYIIQTLIGLPETKPKNTNSKHFIKGMYPKDLQTSWWHYCVMARG